MQQRLFTLGKDSGNEEFIITREGYILILLTILLSILGLASSNPLMFVPGFTFQTAFLYFVAIYVIRERPEISIELSLPSTIIKAKQFLTIHCLLKTQDNVTGHIQVKTSSGLFAVLKPSNTIIQSLDKKGTTFIYYAPRRGKERIRHIIFQFAGIQGLFYTQSKVPIQQEIIVLPQPQRIQLPWTLKQKIFDEFISEISINKRGRGDEFLSLRDFQFGDELRHIHWKASARWNQLVTKEFEEPIMLRFVIVVDRSMLMAGPKLEFALSSIVELCSVIRNSNHTCTILVHGNKQTWQYNLMTSPSSFNQLAIHLHNLEPEGVQFNINSLRDYIIHNKLTDSVLIMISDIENEVLKIVNGYTLLKPYIQRMIYFACYTPGFGTLAFHPFESGDIVNINEYYYRTHILEPKVNQAYRMQEQKYNAALNQPFSRFHLIETYNTNILLELRNSLAKMRGSQRLVGKVMK